MTRNGCEVTSDRAQACPSLRRAIAEMQGRQQSEKDLEVPCRNEHMHSARRRNIGAIVCLCDVYVKNNFFFSCFPEFFSSKTLRRGRETRRKMYRPRQRPLLAPLLPVTVRRPCLQDGAQPCVLRLANLTIGT